MAASFAAAVQGNWNLGKITTAAIKNWLDTPEAVANGLAARRDAELAVIRAANISFVVRCASQSPLEHEAAEPSLDLLGLVGTAATMFMHAMVPGTIGQCTARLTSTCASAPWLLSSSHCMHDDSQPNDAPAACFVPSHRIVHPASHTRCELCGE